MKAIIVPLRDKAMPSDELSFSPESDTEIMVLSISKVNSRFGRSVIIPSLFHEDHFYRW